LNIYEGKYKLENKINVAIICSRWNDDINNKLIQNAEKQLLESGVDKSNINLYRVPGAFEIPRYVKKLNDKNCFDVIICLGSLLNKSVAFNFECTQISKELMTASVNSKIPIVNGIIMANDDEEAMNLANEDSINYGKMVVLAALEMISLENKI
jgi:6,7-dimethyl-8-ribityllumazine synthase